MINDTNTMQNETIDETRITIQCNLYNAEYGNWKV